MKSWHNWWRAIEDLLLPTPLSCGLCGEKSSLPVGACQGCLDSLAIMWKQQEIAGYSYFSLFSYQGFGRDLIHSLKFQNKIEIAITLGNFLGLAAREEPELIKADLLVPVPLAIGRLEKRGFNQATILADNINTVWKRPVYEGVLRVRETKIQSGLAAAARKRNMQRAFAMVPGFDIRDKHCLIVDDVITSGSTFCALAQLIEEYGGKPMGLFVARTEISRSDDHA